MGRIDRRNRRIAVLIGIVLAAAGAVGAAVGAGVFGTARSHHAVFGPTVVRWWNEGGWKSFAVVVAIGVVALGLGLWLALPQMMRNDALRRTQAMVLSDSGGTRGETTLQAPALSHGVEADLERIPDIRKAAVGLFGVYPRIELRGVIEVTDDADLDRLPARIEDVFQRVHASTGVRLEPIRLTVSFSTARRELQLR